MNDRHDEIQTQLDEFQERNPEVCAMVALTKDGAILTNISPELDVVLTLAHISGGMAAEIHEKRHDEIMAVAMRGWPPDGTIN